MKNSGVDAEKDFVDRLEDVYGKRVFIERLPDTKAIKGALKGGFIQGRPSDFLVTLCGEMHYAEVKSCSDPVSFPFSNFRADQWKAMKKQRAAGGVYYVYILNINTNQWFRISGDEVLSIEEGGKKSIKWSELELWKI